MGYKWKPSAAQRKAFTQKMQADSDFAADYQARKDAKADKRRAGSQFNYNTAGGKYVPTRAQYDFAMQASRTSLTSEQCDALNQVIAGFNCLDKVHHDYIHIVNELIRSK